MTDEVLRNITAFLSVKKSQKALLCKVQYHPFCYMRHNKTYITEFILTLGESGTCPCPEVAFEIAIHML